jgi:hypothetical protein
MHLHKYNIVSLPLEAGICFLLTFFGSEGAENESGSIKECTELKGNIYVTCTIPPNLYNRIKLMIIKRNEGVYFMENEEYIVLLLYD